MQALQNITPEDLQEVATTLLASTTGQSMDFFIKLLMEGDEETKRRTALIVSQVPIHATVDYLLERIGKEGFESKVEAKEKLNKIYLFIENITDTLIHLLEHKSSQVREASVISLGELGDEKAIKPIIGKLLHDESWIVRKEAATVLGKFDGAEVESALYKALDDGDQWVREEARKSLEKVKSGRKGIIDSLIQSMQDQDVQVRESAIFSLSELGAKRAVHSILEEMESSKDTRMKEICFSALKKMKAREELRGAVLLVKEEGLKKDVVHEIREAAENVEVLVDEMKIDLEDVDKEIMDACIQAIYDLRQDALDLIISRVDTTDYKVRVGARKAIKYVYRKNKDVVQKLCQMMKSPSCRFKKNIVMCLGEIGEKSTCECLMDEFRKESDEHMRETYSQSICFTTSKLVEDDLRELLRSENNTKNNGKVICEFLMALGRIKSSKSIDLVASFLKDSRWYVSKEAAIALSEIDGTEALQILLEFMETNFDPLIHKHVIQALSRLEEEGEGKMQ